MEAEDLFNQTRSQSRDRKLALLQIFEKNRAECYGDQESAPYIDICVRRQFVNAFIEDIIDRSFLIRGISWWEYSLGNGKYSLGGFKSKHFDGWYWEICFGDDEIDVEQYLQNDPIEQVIRNINLRYKEIIEQKTLTFATGEEISYKKHDFLTPGFWIVTPDDW
jgi:hypothetical protein